MLLLRPLLLAALLGLTLAPPAAAQRIPDGAFARVEGGRFVVEGRPASFLGANFDGLHGERRHRYREVLEALRRDGASLGRQWVVGEGPASPSEWARRYELVRAGPDGFIDESYAQLDRILAAARELGIRLILTLSNHWPDYGGVPAYLRWAGLPEGGPQAAIRQEAFYRDERTRAYYRAALDRLLLRTNTVTGVRYVDDPTIFAWELMNESGVLTPQGAAWRRAWIVEMARHIRSRDRNHLIAPGLLGYSSRAERREWIAVHQLPEVDYCDSHLYLEAPDAASLARRLTDALDDRAQLAHFVIRKPLLLGEFGFRTDRGPLLLGQPRALWFRRFLGQVLRNGGGGALLWIYEPFSGTARDYGIYIDRPETEDVRAVVRQFAPQFAAAPPLRNRRLGPAVGDRLLYEPVTRLRGHAAPHGAWERAPDNSRTLRIAPEAFSAGQFERAGVWSEGALMHAYGADAGFFEYRFAAPGGGPPAALRIEARLSSEWPGRSAPPDGGSEVRVLLDGVEVGRLRVVPDDGLGRWEQLEVRDPALCRRLAAGVHTLRLQVDDAPDAHGITIYGAATGKEPVPAGRYEPMRLTFLPDR